MQKFNINNFPFLNINILSTRVSWSITLRWLAVTGYFIATLVAKYGFDLTMPYCNVWLILALLTIVNGIYLLIFRLFKKLSFKGEIVFLQFHIVIDLLFLTALLHYSGGIENPIYFFYAFHVILSSIIFPGRTPLVIATLAVILFSSMIYLEYTEILHHYSIFSTNSHTNVVLIYVTLAVFIITIYVTMYICMSIMYIYREVKFQIDQQNLQLIEADKQKTRFFRFTSHELKSPVVAIKSSIDSIIKNFSNQMDKRATELLQRASRRSDQMLEIIRELLELSKNRLMIASEIELIKINQLILEQIELQKVQVDEKGIDLKVDLTDKELEVYGHPESFKEIFQNLLSNAIRYTKEKGSISIKTKDFGEKFELSIKDNGIGIAKEDIPKIFEEFYRSENAKKEIKFGTGLGLSIVKQIVENYGGKINVDSNLGKGTKFSILFPKKAEKIVHQKKEQRL
jgi:signal transduction histidine kinase